MFSIRLLITGFLVVFFAYLLLPTPEFPTPPVDAVQSQEPGDQRDLTHFRAYFTNMSRDEIMQHYVDEFNHLSVFSFVPSYGLNYPPEHAQFLVADQIRSSYLEEIVYPFRESLFINGYEPKEGEDTIAFNGTPYKTKMTIRYYTSAVLIRSAVMLVALSLLTWIWWEYLWNFKQIFKPKDE